MLYKLAQDVHIGDFKCVYKKGDDMNTKSICLVSSFCNSSLGHARGKFSPSVGKDLSIALT